MTPEEETRVNIASYAPLEKRLLQESSEVHQLSDQRLPYFLNTFGWNGQFSLSPERGPLLLGFDFLIERESGRPILLEINNVPNNIIMYIGAEAYQKMPVVCEGKEALYGFSQYISLGKLIDIWESYDAQPAPGLTMLAVTARDKLLTHKVFPEDMAPLVSDPAAEGEAIVLLKPRYGSKGGNIYIGSGIDAMNKDRTNLERLADDTFKHSRKRERFAPGMHRHLYLFEKFVPSELLQLSTGLHAQSYRVVYFVGLKGGKYKAEHVATYRRVSQNPIDKNKNENIVNVSTGARRMPVSERESTLLQQKIEDLIHTFFQRAESTQRYSELIHTPFFFLYTDAGQDDLSESWERFVGRGEVLKSLADQGALFSYKHFRDTERDEIDSAARAINDINPELAIVNSHLVEVSVQGSHDYWWLTRKPVGEEILWEKLCPGRNLLIYPSNGMDAQELKDEIQRKMG